MDNLTEVECIEHEIDMALDELKERGYSKLELIEQLQKIPGLLDELRFLRTILFGEDRLRDGLFLKQVIKCNMLCYKPWVHGCRRYARINPDIDEYPDCSYYGI